MCKINDVKVKYGLLEWPTVCYVGNSGHEGHSGVDGPHLGEQRTL